METKSELTLKIERMLAEADASIEEAIAFLKSQREMEAAKRLGFEKNEADDNLSDAV